MNALLRIAAWVLAIGLVVEIFALGLPIGLIFMESLAGLGGRQARDAGPRMSQRQAAIVLNQRLGVRLSSRARMEHFVAESVPGVQSGGRGGG